MARKPNDENKPDNNQDDKKDENKPKTDWGTESESGSVKKSGTKPNQKNN